MYRLPTIADLHIPGVVKIPALTRLAEQNHYTDSAIVTYLPPDTFSSAVGSSAREPHILVNLGYLYDSTLDGAHTQRLASSADCFRRVAVRPAGDLAACRGRDGIQLFPLFGSQADMPRLLLSQPRDANGYLQGTFDGASWTPDGTHLAVVYDTCTIGVYTLTPTYDAVHLTATLTFDTLSTCDISNPVWSPDGKWLAFTKRVPPSLRLYLLPLSGPLAHLFRHEAAPVTIAVTDAMLVDRGTKGDIAPPSWSRDATHLTFVGEDETSMVTMDVTTGQRTTLVKQQAASMCDLSETPDGRHVVFGLCRSASEPEAIVPPEQFYVYTPPSEHA
ncbi:MAG TPA: hypothetical protein VF510_26720 [Ktedonobacterales bacterium]